MKGKRERVGLRYAINGIIAVFRTEWNFRFHIGAMLFVICFAIFFQVTPIEWIALTIVIGFVFVTEIFNTVAEKIIDYFKPECHPIAGYIKDVAAGGVLISALTAVIVGLIIFMPKVISIFF